MDEDRAQIRGSRQIDEISDLAMPPCAIAAWTIGDAPWRLAMVNARGSCQVGVNAQVSRFGHHDCALRGSDVMESLTAFEKALERDHVSRRVERH